MCHILLFIVCRLPCLDATQIEPVFADDGHLFPALKPWTPKPATFANVGLYLQGLIVFRHHVLKALRSVLYLCVLCSSSLRHTILS